METQHNPAHELHSKIKPNSIQSTENSKPVQLCMRHYTNRYFAHTEADSINQSINQSIYLVICAK